MEDFFDTYLQYTKDTEAGAIYHRWASISAVATLLGRNMKLRFGHFEVFPNMYMMLIGEPGTRKSTAIKIVKDLVQQTGYDNFSPNRTSKEKFLAKLARGMSRSGPSDVVDNLLEQNLFGSSVLSPTSITECFICNDEFNNFIGIANMEFISILGELWDFKGLYENELKGSESDYIPNPCINILGGNTHENFSAAFPATVLGQGFFSRLLLIYGERTRPKITFPPPPDYKDTEYIVDWLKKIRAFEYGEITLSNTAEILIDKIYKTWKDLNDPRFASYSNRRFTHLLKLICIYTATRFSRKVEEIDVLKANTVLSFTEGYMPKAMGEIGKSRKSDVIQKVMSIINNAEGIVKFTDIWKHMTGDLDKMSDLSIILENLRAADKIQAVASGEGLLPKRQVLAEAVDGLIDYDIISVEERNMKR